MAELRDIFWRLIERLPDETRHKYKILWTAAEAEGVLKTYLSRFVSQMAKANSLSVEDITKRFAGMADAHSNESATEYFQNLESDENFSNMMAEANKRMDAEEPLLNEEEKALLEVGEDANQESDNDKGGDTNMSEDKSGLNFPSLDRDQIEEADRLRQLAFQKEIREKEAVATANREAKRLWQLEQALIKEQGGLTMTGLDRDYLKKWIEENPEEYAKWTEKWSDEDKGREEIKQAQREACGPNLFDTED